MTDLRPCRQCDRHVRASDVTCPFCGEALHVAPPIHEPRARLCRAAVFAAATALTATAACWTGTTEPKHVEHVEHHTVITPDAAQAETAIAPPVDAAAVVATPRPDAAIVQQQHPPPPPPFDPSDPSNTGRRVQHHPCTMTPKGPICAPYGAPPARRRVV